MKELVQQRLRVRDVAAARAEYGELAYWPRITIAAGDCLIEDA